MLFMVHQMMLACSGELFSCFHHGRARDCPVPFAIFPYVYGHHVLQHITWQRIRSSPACNSLIPCADNLVAYMRMDPFQSNPGHRDSGSQRPVQSYFAAEGHS